MNKSHPTLTLVAYPSGGCNLIWDPPTQKAACIPPWYKEPTVSSAILGGLAQLHYTAPPRSPPCFKLLLPYLLPGEFTWESWASILDILSRAVEEGYLSREKQNWHLWYPKKGEEEALREAKFPRSKHQFLKWQKQLEGESPTFLQKFISYVKSSYEKWKFKDPPSPS